MRENSFVSGKEYCQLIESDLIGIKRTAEKMIKLINQIKVSDDAELIKKKIHMLVQETEKAALKGRSLPLFKTAWNEGTDGHAESPVMICMKDEVLFMEVPLLMPKIRKPKADKSYLVNTLHSAFKAYFSANNRRRYEEPVVIWFELVYRFKTGRNPMRDHDNVEAKVVKDLLVPYIVTDDSPIFCDDLCTSRFGDADLTYIHVIPRRIFPDYFKERVESHGSIP